MKILVNNYENTDFKLQVLCKQTEDKYGYIYGNAEDFCGSTLEVEADDIREHCWSKGWSAPISGKSYVVVCPLCGEWIEISAEKIPKTVRDNARRIIRNG